MSATANRVESVLRIMFSFAQLTREGVRAVPLGPVHENATTALFPGAEQTCKRR
jgi:hypothetical protein